MTGLRLKRLVLAVVLLTFLFGCGEVQQGEPPRGKAQQEEIQQNERLLYDPDASVKSKVYLGGSNAGGKSISELTGILTEYAAKTWIAPVDATVDAKTWDVKTGKAGKRLNVEKTIDNLIKAGEGDRVGYVFDTVQPSVTAGTLKKKIRLISGYTTTLLDRSASRVNNIRLASKKINNTILKPGEEFSFNNIVGRRTAAKGYMEAPIIVRTPYGPGKRNAHGGGVCQISTTIYNAVEKCGLKVTERHIHSKDVGYVPRGEDATVSYGSVDFRFVNSGKYPIMLKVHVKGRFLGVRILENTI